MSVDTINVQLTAQDYLAANRLHGGLTRQFLVFAAGILAFGVMPYVGGRRVDFIPDVLTPVAVFVAFVLAVILGTRYLYLPRRTGRLYAQQKSMQRPFAMRWDEDNVYFDSEEYSARTPWSDFSKWREGKDIFMLYLSDVMFRIVPKRDFPDENAMAEFRELLHRKIAPEGAKRAKTA